MQYGAMNFPVRPVVSEIEAFAEMGFDYLELALDPPQAHYSQVRQQKNEILASLTRNRLGLVCHLPTFVYTADLTASIRKASLGEMLESLETAAELGAGKAVLHPGLITGLAPFVPETVRGYAMESLAAIVARGDRLGIDLCLENMFPRYQACVEPDDFMEVFRNFPGLKMTLDTGHAHIDDPSGQRLMSLIERLGHRLGHIHVSDNHGRKDEHIPLGAGSIKFSKVVKALKKTGYDDTITLEVFCEDRRKLVESRQRLAALWDA